MRGYIHSFQSLGTVDGPGVRFVVFFQGCPLRCACCHNPDTWDTAGGTAYTVDEVIARVIRCREYFGERGGITASGGEPLLQPAFLQALFSECHRAGVGTCLDTSGVILNDEVKAALSLTDRVLLDVKFTSDEAYRQYVGCSIKPVMEFLKYLDSRSIPTTLRQVIIPGLNDTQENICRLMEIARDHSCVDDVELLAFRKMCQVKYDALGIPFPLQNTPQASREDMERVNVWKKQYAV